MDKNNHTTDYEVDITIEQYDHGLIDSASEKKQLICFIGNIQGARVLDLGCGNGQFTEHLALLGAESIGVDRSEHFIQIAKSRYDHARFFRKDGSRLHGFPDNWFDIIILANVLPNIPSSKKIEKILKECVRVLKESGRLILSVVNPDSVRNYSDLIRKITVSGSQSTEELKPGTIYQSSYRLSDGTWISFSDSHWPRWFIRDALLKCGLTIVDVKPHIPKEGEVPSKYLSCYQSLPIRLFYKGVKYSPSPLDYSVNLDRSAEDMRGKTSKVKS